jgi:hypothetical protein
MLVGRIRAGLSGLFYDLRIRLPLTSPRRFQKSRDNTDIKPSTLLAKAPKPVGHLEQLPDISSVFALNDQVQINGVVLSPPQPDGNFAADCL